MIRCELVLRDGMLMYLESRGHAAIDNANARVSIACAAASALIRSCGSALEQSKTINIELDRFLPGDIQLRVTGISPGSEDWLKGVSTVLAQGLADVQRDFPDQLQLKLSC